MFAETFVKELKEKAGIFGRPVLVRNSTGLIFVNFYNLPPEVMGERAGGGAEAENNRQMFMIDYSDFAKTGKVKITHRVSALDRKYNLRGKTAKPENILQYLVDHIAMVVREVEPNYIGAVPSKQGS